LALTPKSKAPGFLPGLNRRGTYQALFIVVSKQPISTAD
jgi:hypothetical protein